eukprot:TRINITY_DN2715_c0_g1_i1.p1 TRINITY_DN2715_c0_g1~~TRINITY_DN2715_c0_g1_i1.p1  ORF type:complete len:289 (+),score=53.95 TRINITY_DN2715_c0_g1_i1:47-868(+)
MSDDELKLRDTRRKREDEILKLKVERDTLEEERREREERKRKEEELRKRRNEELKLEELGSPIIEELPRPPPSVLDEKTVQGSCMKAWHLDNKSSASAFTRNSIRPGKRLDLPSVTLRELKGLGVSYWKVNLNDFSIVNQMCKEHNYKHLDEVKLHQTTKDEGTLEKWFTEHFNADHQLRLVIEGSMFVDVRSKEDTWIRMHLLPGDFITILPGIYYRETLDEDDYVWVMRLLRDSGRWIPLPRSENNTTHPARLEYTSSLRRGSLVADAPYV